MAVLATLCFLFLASNALIPTGVVMTTNGPVRGYIENGVKIFKGIPFAAPPVGDLRFKPPQPVTPWKNTIDCFESTKFCPELRAGPIVYGTEDCLYLNVFAPEGASSSNPLPVMVWIFGGGFVIGTDYQNGHYDGSALARQHNVIIIAMNYRLSILGFMALDSLLHESNTTGNYGFQDQRMGMQWAQANAAKFGGNPAQTTLFGESAGGFSVCAHLTTAASRGLFQAAILESATCDSPQFFRALPNATAWGNTYAGAVGCPDPTTAAACMRAQSVDKVMSGHVMMAAEMDKLGWRPPLYPLMPWALVLDGSPLGLIETPLKVIEAGGNARVPVLMGTNKDEGTIFIPMLPLMVPGVLLPLNAQYFQSVLAHFFNASTAAQITKVYPLNGQSYDALAAGMMRDFIFVCATGRALRALSNQGLSTWRYRFAFAGNWTTYPVFGDTHTSELPFVFDNLHEQTPLNVAMAAAMGTYWTNFAKCSNPNGGSGCGTAVSYPWPPYNTSVSADIILAQPLGMELALGSNVCPFWDTVQ